MSAPAPPAPSLLWGLLPAGSYAGRSRALLLRSATASQRTWLAFVSGFFEPVFYLVAMGQGLGSLVGTLPGPDGAPISYAAFIAPGLLAASAMNGAVFDSTYNVFFKLKYGRLYDAMLATPLGPVDIALGEIGWALIRGGLYALGFLAVMGGFGLLASPWALLALPAALLVAFAFAAVGMAATSFMRSWQDFDWSPSRAADVPVLHHVLPAVGVSPMAADPGRVPAALPRGRAHARLTPGRARGHVRPSGVLPGHDRVGVVVAARRLDALLLADAPRSNGRRLASRDSRQVDDERMTVTSQRSVLRDGLRSAAVALLAVVQVVVAALAGTGAIGEPIGVVAKDYGTPLLAADWAFLIWAPIYVGFLGYALYQLLPAQRGREIHRRTGWACRLGRVQRHLDPGLRGPLHLLAELLIVALMVVLAVTFGRLSREPAADVVERVAFRGPIALYTGWVSLAVVLGTAATGVAVGLPGSGALSTVAAVVVLLAVAAIVAWVVLSGTAVIGYVVAVVWALAGVALNDPPAAVVVAGAFAIVVVLASTARRLTTAGNPPRAAWG